MEKLIDKFEKAIKMSVRDLTEEDLTNILKNEDYRDFFKNPDEVLTLFKEIVKLNNNEIIKKEVNTIIYNVELIKAEATVDANFNSYSNDEITRDTLETTITEFISGDDAILSLVATSCALLSLQNVDLKEYEDKIKNNLKLLKDVFNEVGNLDSSYSVRSILIDFLFQIREDYFTQYSVDLIDDMDWINEQLVELQKYEDENLRKDIPSSVDVTPEELGYIDITKLKEKGGE